ncbi:MAG: D-alanyl-D-alanine endopeptidase [Acidiferrobacterales bacterium]
MQPEQQRKPHGVVITVALIAMGFAQLAIAVLQQGPDSDGYEASTTLVPASQIVRQGKPHQLFLRSSVALVVDEREGVILLDRNSDEQRSIASLTKLMTALVIIEADLPFDELIDISWDDRDYLRGSRSRLRIGTVLTRYDMLLVALAASDNRAAAALARTYPGGEDAIIAAMNRRAWELGMIYTRFVEPTGLSYDNVSTARDLAKLIAATREYPLIHHFSTRREFLVDDWGVDRVIVFRNTNALVHKNSWDVVLSKTGFTAAAGRCLLMRTRIANRPLAIILLNSWGRLSKYGDANRIRKWLLTTERKIKTLAPTFASF